MNEERITRWRLTRSILDSAIFELQRSIRRQQNAIDVLAGIISKAEAAEDAQKKNWGIWFFNQVSKTAVAREDEIARKDRQRQERRIEKDFKERKIETLKAQLQEKEKMLQQSEKENSAADARHDLALRAAEARIRQRRAGEQQQQNSKAAETERMEKARSEEQARQQEKRAQQEKQAQQEKRAEQEKRAREATETWRQRLSRAQTASTAPNDPPNRQAEQTPAYDWFRSTRPTFTHSPHQTPPSICTHGGWWDKVQGRTTCTECDEVWTYLLMCPGCGKQACPKCQRDFRPQFPDRAATTRGGRKGKKGRNG